MIIVVLILLAVLLAEKYRKRIEKYLGCPEWVTRVAILAICLLGIWKTSSLMGQV